MMENEEIKIYQLDPSTFLKYDYSDLDQDLVQTLELDTDFVDETDYIEFFVYDDNNTLIYPLGSKSLKSYAVREGDVVLNPIKDLQFFGFDVGIYNIIYNFYRKILSSDNSGNDYFVSTISSDRTEIRLDTNIIDDELVISSANEFINYRFNSSYFVDFYLNFGGNTLVIANNIVLDISDANNATLLIKLYDPLPLNINEKDKCWLVEKLSRAQGYQVDFPFIPEIEDDFVYLSGPNFNLDIKTQTGKTGQNFSYNTLLNSNITSSVNQIRNLLGNKKVRINVDYEDFGNFVHFSSAKTRLENFYYKVGLIESASSELSSSFLGQISSSTTASEVYSSSAATLDNYISGIIENFDGYESFLYFNSGSDYSWPKSSSSPPFILYGTGSLEVTNWIGSADPNSINYGGLALSASDYDQSNQDWLYWSIPEYLRDDEDNLKYELFLDMVGQHFDNIWIYTKDITNKFDTDNRIAYGISKNLVSQAIKDFGIKLYSNKFNTEDLYTAFLGITDSGSTFPVTDITETFPVTGSFEYVESKISASSDNIPLDDVNKRLYKRIYHNLPYILKTKGTVSGLRAIITSYGIPDTILRINEFGGKDNINSQDWDLEQRIFNYSLDTGGFQPFVTNFQLHPSWSSDFPKTIQFRFKPGVLPTSSVSNSVWVTDFGGGAGLFLEYSGSGLISASHSGSAIESSSYYATLKLIPDVSTPQFSASVELPFYDGNWWSVMTIEDGGTASLYAASKIRGQVGFSASDSLEGFNSASYEGAGLLWFPWQNPINLLPDIYNPLTGSLQEIRYYAPEISESSFYDYVLNPLSIKGNGEVEEELAFRADLGTVTEYIDGIVAYDSIHPKTTGSSEYITSSFPSTNFYQIFNYTFSINTETIHQDQVPVGVQNRVTERIKLKDNIIAESPYSGSEEVTMLSPIRSVQQSSDISQSFTPNSKYIEVGFSPHDQINDDINSHFGYFNIGEYVGDPREISSSLNYYPDLKNLLNSYFQKYYKSYNVVDFVRLVKSLDNSLFKMIEDFIPARNSSGTGIIIKNPILHRNKFRPPQVSSSKEVWSGSLVSQTRGYISSSDFGSYESYSGSSIYKIVGGTGGVLDEFNNLNTSISASDLSLTNRLFLTQSFTESISGSLNSTSSFPNYSERIDSYQKEFYNGEFDGTVIIASTSSLNVDCDPYKKPSRNLIQFNPIFYSFDSISSDGTLSQDNFSNPSNCPTNGDVWIGYGRNSNTGFNEVRVIKFPTYDINNNFVRDYLPDSGKVQIRFSENNLVEYNVDSFIIYFNCVIMNVSTTTGDYAFTSSIDGGSENWSLIARGSYNTSGSIPLNAFDGFQQGTFLDPNVEFQLQYFFYWDGDIHDPLNFFNTGSTAASIHAIENQSDSIFSSGSYAPMRLPNIPLLFSASVGYSASFTALSDSVSGSGIYHSSSKYTPNSVDQSAVLNSSTSSAIYRPNPAYTYADLKSLDFFDATRNTLIPGGTYQGSVTPHSSHWQIDIPGTASFDFYFPYLTIAGDSSVALISPLYTPFSGSALTASNQDFSTSSISVYDISEMSTSASQGDGELTINVAEIEQYGLDNKKFGGEAKSSSFVSGEVFVNYRFTANSALNITSSFQYRESTGSWILPLEQVGNYSEGDGNGAWQVNNVNGIPITQSGDNRFRIRPVVISPNVSEFDYTYQFYDCVIKFTNEITYGRAPILEEHSILLFSSEGQGGVNNGITIATASNFEVPTVDIQVHLKSTSSLGIRTITSSDVLSSTPIYRGITFNFPDSPILDIYNPTTGSDTTINVLDEAYYVEYSMSNFQTGSGVFDSVDVDFISDGDLLTRLIITQSQDTSSVSNYNFTGSLLIAYDENVSERPDEVGPVILSDNFIVADETSVGRASFTGSFQHPFKVGNVFRMGIEAVKNAESGLVITDYTMSIYPSQSINSPITSSLGIDTYRLPTPSTTLIPTFIETFGENILPFNRAFDCQPLLNNVTNIRENPFLYQVDYNSQSGSIIPVNQKQILDRIATNGNVPESNYTIIGSINGRYDGSKTTSNTLNSWNIKDVGTFGQLPAVELLDSYMGYFNSVKDLYPLVNDKISFNISHLIDEQGNAIPPTLDGVGFDILQRTFPQDEIVTLAFISSSKNLEELDDSYRIYKTALHPIPILYSQTSSNGYSSTIPLTGSGRISLYDNNDTNTFHDYSFTAMGTSSFDDNQTLPLGYGNYSQDLDPSEDVTTVYAATTQSYSSSNGIIHYPNSDSGIPGTNDLADQQTLSVEFSYATNFPYWIVGKDRWDQYLITTLQLVSGSVGIPFDLQDVLVKVHFNSGNVSEPESIIDSVRSVNDVTTFYNDNTRDDFYNELINGVKWGIRKDNIQDWLVKKGFYTRGTGGVEKTGTIVAIEYVVKATTGTETIFMKNDQVKWSVDIELKKSIESVANVLFPIAFSGSIMPTKITNQGARSNLLTTDNSGSAPYWVFTGSTGGSSSSLDQSILVMSASNINEAYGSDYFQGNLQYVSGSTQYFPGGIEPSTSKFPKITKPIELKERDEIRFGNNENYTYIINKVIPPQENIEGDGKGRLKIHLNKNVPGSINKDFFLVRRFVEKPNSFIINAEFPYDIQTTESSEGNGLIYPRFPSNDLQQSSSAIITNLTGQGIIK